MISRSAMADAYEQQDLGICPDFAQSLIKISQPIHSSDVLGLDL